ncbi:MULTISPECIES: 3,4-dihydroxy-2-butanone-4-phosphate synthase [Sphingobium]|jgi:3,4-dihydroxy 2-butanone 4-phosphate synthase / GTP cyclohydrolase II|uniref:3,4-dihydroxy-2-butanone-4-phosphate synthase n=1 Tax=Sphingobium TaxID=165695 RepID=UPI000C47203A|nr:MULTISPECIES: 3,4-dihydroxy-2-butanone-4-phosphate synthase [Sphingobium]MBS87421.1 3,4-dihydroxy-2-butanone-4-phosphate synthase [Sphingobium sp.]QWT16229.1 3,4-dihydroxy-2-butanone-4-phosphate synthase [Sphingobium xenophagum]
MAGIATTEALIEDARAGRMFILVDDEARENEGDLIIPAQFATPDAVNFMARHGRGLICLAMTRARVGELQLPAMAQTNGTRHETAFTVSIEAREGVTTGISAADRSRTIQVAIDPTKGADTIVSPGHVFPLVAREGGVLIRAGHTEAAVDFSRLAGLNPSGVICEIMNEDGTMARMPELIRFAEQHRLNIGTIADLIAYRRRTDVLIEMVHEERFVSEYGGAWTARVYRNDTEGSEHLALIKGTPVPTRPTLVRMHNYSIFDDALAQVGGRPHLLEMAMDMIGREGAGVLVMVRNFETMRYTDLIRASRVHQTDISTPVLRDYGVGAQILLDLGLQDLELLTNSRRNTLVGLEGYGLRVVGTRPLPTPMRLAMQA